ncbi:FecR family protein [Chitinophaga vietnamensis]|uniref:FecR family protein n=1 Tax=Chitinophaga vietnamensis TaxID=2593957 RepID=UPI0011780969|nr:FecR family protein [Chitinophaga vietnamensis]
MDQEEIYRLLKKYREGKCSTDEVVMLFTWLDKMAADETPASLPQETQDAVKSAVFQHIGAAPKRRITWLRRSLAAAAVLLPLCIAGAWWWHQHPSQSKAPALAWLQYRTGIGESKDIILPDGTHAWLSAASVLEYPKQFSAHDRTVKVQGQVFFDVHQDQQKPFTVASGPLQVHVLGTSFLVRNIKGQPSRIAVASGKVQVTTERQVLGTLQAAQQLFYYHETALICHTDTAVLNASTKGDLILYNSTLQQALWELESFYGVQFSSHLNLGQGRLNLSLTSNMTLEQKLDVISTVSVAPKVHFKKTGDHQYEVY